MKKITTILLLVVATSTVKAEESPIKSLSDLIKQTIRNL